MSGGRASHALVAPLVQHLSNEATLVLDAAAILALLRDETLLHPLQGRAVLTPHTGEMAERFGAVVALKGAESWIAEPGGKLLHFDGGDVGLATSGSGDTLAGIVAGLAARGATPVQAAAWAVYLHAAAGRALAKRIGRIGFLARELLDEIPKVMRVRA